MLKVALLAQLAEHSPCKREVTGSNPSMRHQIIFSLSVSGLYRLLWEQEFVGSNPTRETSLIYYLFGDLAFLVSIANCLDDVGLPY